MSKKSVCRVSMQRKWRHSIMVTSLNSLSWLTNQASTFLSSSTLAILVSLYNLELRSSKKIAPRGVSCEKLKSVIKVVMHFPCECNFKSTFSKNNTRKNKKNIYLILLIYVWIICTFLCCNNCSSILTKKMLDVIEFTTVLYMCCHWSSSNSFSLLKVS